MKNKIISLFVETKEGYFSEKFFVSHMSIIRVKKRGYLRGKEGRKWEREKGRNENDEGNKFVRQWLC